MNQILTLWQPPTTGKSWLKIGSKGAVPAHDLPHVEQRFRVAGGFAFAAVFGHVGIRVLRVVRVVIVFDYRILKYPSILRG